jgi:hypothetical protein
VTALAAAGSHLSPSRDPGSGPHGGGGRHAFDDISSCLTPSATHFCLTPLAVSLSSFLTLSPAHQSVSLVPHTVYDLQLLLHTRTLLIPPLVHSSGVQSLYRMLAAQAEKPGDAGTEPAVQLRQLWSEASACKCVRLCVCVCARARVRVRVRACAGVRASVYVCVSDMPWSRAAAVQHCISLLAAPPIHIPLPCSRPTHTAGYTLQSSSPSSS